MGISFIVQARMGSSRLPNKILKPFYKNKSILELLVEKLQLVQSTQLIIATSNNSKDDVIEDFCKSKAIKYFRGSEEDVLDRFICAAESFNAERIIRVCSDNPFLELQSINELVSKARCSDADYISFKINGQPSIKTHYGFWTEYTTLEVLKKVRVLTEEKIYHEHVTNYIYSHPTEFNIEWIDGPTCLKDRFDIRLTCDTETDFNCTSEIYSKIRNSTKHATIEEVVKFLDSNPKYFNNMVQQIKDNSK